MYYVCKGAHEGQINSVGSLGAGVMSGCELPDVGARN